MNNTNTTHTQSPARAFLRAASAKLKPLAQESEKSVNELLTDIYSNQAQAREWDTFKGWKKRGYYVAKGERGFAVWSRPIKADDAETDTGNTDTDAGESGESGETKPERENFYVAYIFCAAQVKNREGYTPDGAEYTPTNLIPPHCAPAQPTDTKPAESAATDAATDTKPAESAATKPAKAPQPTTDTKPAETRAPATATETPATAQPVKYVQQLALAI